MARATRTSTMVLAAALATLLLLLASAPALASAARTSPAAVTNNKASPDEKSSTAVEAADVECEAAETAEECLARRTLAAHTDYIYTQEHHN